MNKFNLWSAILRVEDAVRDFEHVKGLFESSSDKYLVLQKEHNDELLESSQKLLGALKNELQEIV